MSDAPPPDWAALYDQHKDAMWRAAGRVLREAGRQGEAEDVVMAAIESLISSPPTNVQNWEALMVKTAVRRAVDRLRSAEARHDGGQLTDDVTADLVVDDFIADDVAERVDSERAGALVWDKLGQLDGRDRRILWGRVVHGRSVRELADEFGVSPGRISQIVKLTLERLRDDLDDQLGGGGW